MTFYARLLPTFGLLFAALVLFAVMLDSAGYRWCDTYSDPACPTVTSGPTEAGLH